MRAVPNFILYQLISAGEGVKKDPTSLFKKRRLDKDLSVVVWLQTGCKAFISRKIIDLRLVRTAMCAFTYWSEAVYYSHKPN